MATGGEPADFRCNQDRTNYARLCRVIIDLCTQVLRDVLSRQIPSNEIYQKVQLCPGLRLDPSQKGALRTAAFGDYREFDVSLLYILIRKLCPGISPTKGWSHGFPPTPTETTEGDEVERIHFIRNNVYGHMCETRIPDTKFKQYWQILQGVMTRMDSRLDKNYSQILSVIESDNMDDASQKRFMDLIEELKKSERDLQSQIDAVESRIYQLPAQKQTIQRWAQEDLTFVNTRATESVRALVAAKEFLIVSGVPGSGKSAIIQHIALELQHEGYHIVPVYTADEIIRYWIPEKKQVFVFDDPFGIHKVDEVEVNHWNKRIKSLKDCLKNNKILVSMRKWFAHERLVTMICSNFDHEIIDISTGENLLKEDEKSKIFQTHMRSSGKEITDIKIPSCELLSFPLLCRIFSANRDSVLEMDFFFKRPISVLQKEILRLRDIDRLKYFCLILCLVYDGVLNECMLDVENEDSEGKVKRKAFLDLCGLQTSTSKSQIAETFDILVGTYFIKDGSNYKFLHDAVCDTVVSTLSSKFHLSILKHCSSKFIRQRVIFPEMVKSEDKEENIQPFILLNESFHKAWGDRLVKDIKDGKASDVFFNDCFKLQKCDNILLSSLEGKISESEIEKHLLENISGNVITEYKRKTSDSKDFKFAIFSDYLFHIKCTPLHFIFANQLEKTFMFLWNKIESPLRGQIISSASLICTAAGGGVESIMQTLIDAGSDINIADRHDFTPLMLTSSLGHDKIVQLLVDKGAYINQCGVDHHTALYYASYRGHDTVVRILVDKGADVNQCDKDQNTALSYASSEGHDKVVQILVDKVADVNQCDKDQHTALTCASDRGHDTVVQILVDKGADVNQCDEYHRTALSYASEGGHDAVVQILIDKGADVNQCNKYQRTALFYASKGGHDKAVQLLVDRCADVNGCDADKRTALSYASERGHDKVVQILFDKGGDVNQCDENQRTALYYASVRGHDTVVQILVDKGADVNKCDASQRAAFSYASEEGHDKVVQILVDKGADVNQCKKYQHTALSLASLRGHCTVVQILVEKGADLNQIDDYQRTALSYASERGHDAVVQMLVDKGADVNQCEKYQHSALSYASEGGHDNVVQILVEKGVDVNQCDKYQRSALSYAAEGGHDKVVQILVEKGADVNQCDEDQRSALSYASEGGHNEVVHMLLCKGADVNKCDKYQHTALFYSFLFGHDELVQILVDYGADVNLCY